MKIHGGKTKDVLEQGPEEQNPDWWAAGHEGRPPGRGLRVERRSKAKSEREARSGRDHRSPYAPNFIVSALSNVCKKNHPRGYLEPISLLGECQISLNLTPLAKITCTNGNTQRHIPTPHLPQNYALKTFKVTAVIGLKNWLQLPFRWIPN